MEWIDLGRIEYVPAFEAQRRLHELRRLNHIPDTLLFQENPPVITCGRSFSAENLLTPPEQLSARGVSVVEVNRGGDVSYHGPGQLVVSPIVRLRDRVATVHEYLRMLEEVVIHLLQGYGIVGLRVQGASGVWVTTGTAQAKIAATGIAVSHGVTQHGFALNVNPNLEHFSLIRPCGLENTAVTSLAAQTGRAPGLSEVRTQLLSSFAQVFAGPLRPSGIEIAHITSSQELKKE